MRLYTVSSKGEKKGFIFKESAAIYPKIRAEITARIAFEFHPTAFEDWKKLTEQEQEKLIRTVASKELTVEDLRVKILQE